MAEPIITLKVDGTSVTVHPVFGDNVKIQFSKDKDQVFHRTKVDGTVKFVREDFDLIASCSHNSVLTVGVYNGSTLLGECDFLKSDCELDYDDRVCTVKISTKDKYEDFLAKYDNKYNLPKLAPAITPLTLHKRPILQFYFLHDKKITNCYGNMSFEVTARSGAEDYTASQVSNCGFREVGFFIAMDIPNLTGLSSVYGRYWIGGGGEAGVGMKVYRDGNDYYLEYKYDSYHLAYYWQLYYANGTAYTVNGEYVYVSGHELSYPTHEYGNSIKRGSSYTDSTNLGNGMTYTRDVYARILSDFDGSIAGEVKTPMNTVTEDVGEDNYNYLNAWSCTTFGINSALLVDDKVQDDPTEWGIDGDEKYFVKPDPQSSENAIYPIGWSMWIPFSFWFESSPSFDTELRAAFDTTYQLPDTYAIHDAINLLLQAMGVQYDFQANSPYSNFLYGSAGSLMDTIPTPALRGNYIYITPITNVKKTRYEQPARKGDITLKQILDMFRKVYQCYWYLDTNDRLCIEHISYFKNTEEYGLFSPEPIINLTTMKDMPNGKNWSFDTNKVKFNRKNCPSRYEFAWGNDVTEQFNGYAIDILDRPAEGTGKEENTVTNFTADIDYSVIYPQGVNDDIYAIIEANKTSGAVGIIDVTLLTGNPVYQMQNGFLSFLFAEQYYWPYDLGGWDARIEGQMMPVYAVRHLLQQSVGVPLAGIALNLPLTILSVRTELGIGLMEEASVNIDTLYSDTDLTMQVERDDYRDQLTLSRGGYSHGLFAIYISNNSNTLLSVKYKYNGSVSTTTIAGQSSTIVATGASVQVDDVQIISAEQDNSHNVCIGNVVKRYGSHIEDNIIQTTHTAINATFDGGGYTGSADFAYIKVKINKACSVTITPSTENNCDYGYVATKPCATKARLVSPGVGIVYASGSTAKTATLTAGQEVFIGYLKDSSAVSGSDTVTIAISEV